MRYLAGAFLIAMPALASTLCQPCHPKHVSGFARTPMAQSLRPVSLNIAPEFAKPVQFLHPKTGRRYRAYTNSGAFVLEEFVQGAYSDVRKPVLVIGSGAHARSFLVARGQSYFQAPVTFYAQAGNWDMSPGYDTEQHVGFTRRVTAECLFCHTGSSATPTAIDCERCHGPSEAHRKTPPKSIVNPAKLPPRLREQVCEQCHLMGASRVVLHGRKLSQYRPGARLEDVVAAFQFESTGAARVTGHPEQMKRSRCYAASSDRMWCGSCHNVHTPIAAAERAQFYRSRCLNCHKTSDCAEASSGKRDCVACHMPKMPVLESTHVAFSNHQIPRRPPVHALPATPSGILKPLLPPPSEPALLSRALGVAYLETASDTGRSDLTGMGLSTLDALSGTPLADADYWLHKAEAHLKLNQRDRAVEAFQQALRLDARSAPALYGLAFMHHSAGRLVEALPLYRRAVAADPEFTEAWRNLASALDQLGRKAEARVALQRVLVLNPGDLGARRALGSLP